MEKTIYQLSKSKEKHSHYCDRCRKTWTHQGPRDCCGALDTEVCKPCVNKLDAQAYQINVFRHCKPPNMPIKPVKTEPITAEDFFND